VNHGLFFAGPPQSPLGTVSRKISQKPMSGDPNDGVNVAVGARGPAGALHRIAFK
jgi:hypothetical protein